jgi:hypothetical protein
LIFISDVSILSSIGYVFYQYLRERENEQQLIKRKRFIAIVVRINKGHWKFINFDRHLLNLLKGYSFSSSSL